MRTNWEIEQAEREAELAQFDNECAHLGGYECAECLLSHSNITCFYLENQECCPNFKSKFEVL